MDGVEGCTQRADHAQQRRFGLSHEVSKQVLQIRSAMVATAALRARLNNPVVWHPSAWYYISIFAICGGKFWHTEF